MSAASQVHSLAQSGFKEGTNDLYDRARPSYPAETLHTIAAAFPQRPAGKGLTILEPGSGTGIFSRLLLAPPTPAFPSIPVRTLVAVEPSAGMRNAWQRGLARLPDGALTGKEARTVEGSFLDFSKSGVEKGSVDAVVIAQAWHWCPDHAAALREILDYLAPDGVLVLTWNIESNDPGYYRALRELYQPLDLGSPQYYRMLWRKMFDVDVYKASFEPPEETQVRWSVEMDEDKLLARLETKSYLTEAHLNGERRAQFEADVRRIIREGDKDWVDKEHGIFLYRYYTDTLVIRRKQPVK